MFKPYTVKLDDGKYTVINHGDQLEYLLDGKPWQIGVANMCHAKIVHAMVERIEELEVAIKSVLDGTLLDALNRNDDGMCDFRESAWSIPLGQWKTTLRNVLEQK